MTTDHTCPTCRGTKTVTLTVLQGDSETEQELDCTDCEGTGSVSDERLEEMRRFAEMWCTCESPQEVRYVDDGEDDDLPKHHWRCARCDGVTQIG